MTKTVAEHSDAKGDVCSFRILVGVADKPDDSIWYLENPVKKLIVLAENENDDN